MIYPDPLTFPEREFVLYLVANSVIAAIVVILLGTRKLRKQFNCHPLPSRPDRIDPPLHSTKTISPYIKLRKTTNIPQFEPPKSDEEHRRYEVFKYRSAATKSRFAAKIVAIRGRLGNFVTSQRQVASGVTDQGGSSACNVPRLS